MEQPLDLIAETIGHFSEGARSVKAYTDDKTYIITKASDSSDFWITLEEPGFPKTKISSLDQHFRDVFGIEAHY